MVSLMCLVIALSRAIKLGNMAEVWVRVTNLMSSDGEKQDLRLTPSPRAKTENKILAGRTGTISRLINKSFSSEINSSEQLLEALSAKTTRYYRIKTKD